MRYGSLCSGIEAATCAWHPLGWRPQFFSEIDKAASRFLAHTYPDTPNLGDMTKFQEWPDHAIDLLAGGTPCQSFSVAGLRKGLADPRGNLMLTYLAIADRYRPKWLVWENVPGVLSSDGGRDFASFLGGLGQLGYGWAYRVLDAQYVRVESHPWAVPQRRRRVFVVGCAGGWQRAAAVLFERESLCGHSPPRRETGQGTARGFETGPHGGGFTDIAPTMDCRAKDGPIRNQLGVGVLTASTGDVAHCLNAGGMGRIDYESETMVAHSLRAEGVDASEDGTGRGTPIVPVPSPAFAFDLRGREGGAMPEGPHDTANLRAASGGSSRSYVAEPIAFSSKDHGADASDEVAPTLRAMGHGASHANAGGQVAVAIQERAVSENPNAGPDGAAYTLEARTTTQAVAFQNRVRGDDGRGYDRAPTASVEVCGTLETVKQHHVALPWAVRRLTPVECERLQGFPDGYTAETLGGKTQADGVRYKQLGNSMAVNCMRWIGERIDAVAKIEVQP